MIEPRHRADCAEWFSSPNQTEYVLLDMPVSGRSAIEHGAAKAGRTWTDQFFYVLARCRDERLPDFDDVRSVEEWRTLLMSSSYRFNETEEWTRLSCLWRKTYEPSREPRRKDGAQ